MRISVIIGLSGFVAVLLGYQLWVLAEASLIVVVGSGGVPVPAAHLQTLDDDADMSDRLQASLKSVEAATAQGASGRGIPAYAHGHRLAVNAELSTRQQHNRVIWKHNVPWIFSRPNRAHRFALTCVVVGTRMQHVHVMGVYANHLATAYGGCEHVTLATDFERLALLIPSEHGLDPPPHANMAIVDEPYSARARDPNHRHALLTRLILDQYALNSDYVLVVSLDRPAPLSPSMNQSWFRLEYDDEARYPWVIPWNLAAHVRSQVQPWPMSAFAHRLASHRGALTLDPLTTPFAVSRGARRLLRACVEDSFSPLSENVDSPDMFSGACFAPTVTPDAADRAHELVQVHLVEREPATGDLLFPGPEDRGDGPADASVLSSHGWRSKMSRPVSLPGYTFLEIECLYAHLAARNGTFQSVAALQEIERQCV